MKQNPQGLVDIFETQWKGRKNEYVMKLFSSQYGTIGKE